MSKSLLYGCKDIQTIRYIIEICPLIKFDMGAREIHVEEYVIELLENLDVHL